MRSEQARLGSTHRTVSFVAVAAGWLALASTAACSLFQPELTTPVRPYPSGAVLAKEGPTTMRYVRIVGASIPPKDQSGRVWDASALGGRMPDAFAVLVMGDKELIRTTVQANSLEPRWPEALGGNYQLPPQGKARVEVWDANTISNHPICIYKTNNLMEEIIDGKIVVRCSSGATVLLEVRDAQPSLGLGLHYEVRIGGASITRVVPASPAGRAGLQPGDELIKIQGKPVAKLEPIEVESLVNANAGSGLELVIRRGAKGAERTVKIREGSVYLETPPAAVLEAQE